MKVLVKDQPLETALGELNIRLKASKRRVSVERQGKHLYLRAALPDRNEPTKRVQQNIALGLGASPRGLVEAVDLAIKLSVDNYQARAKTMHASMHRSCPERGALDWAKKWGTWTPETKPALMRASLPARIGQEKPHESQTPQPSADYPQVAER